MASKMSERLNFKSVEELLGVVNEEAAMDIESPTTWITKRYIVDELIALSGTSISLITMSNTVIR